MRPHLLLLMFVIWSLALGACGQPDQPDSAMQERQRAVRATINALFDGMRAGDSAAVRSLFAPGAQIRSVDTEETEVRGDPQTADAFAQSIGEARDAVWDERVWDVDIRRDGRLATAWMSYVFYVDDKRSHCGVNSLQLVRHAGEWQIQHIAYSRRQDCDVPPAVRK